MTAILIRLIIYAAIIGFIYFGARKIWRDWTAQFRTVDKQRHERDLSERARPDVIDLKRDGDGIFRAPTEKDRQP